MTVLLALAHAFRTNEKFNPSDLYAATFVLDLIIIANLF